MARMVNVHGRFFPGRKAPQPIKTINVNSKRRNTNEKIRLDIIAPLDNPQIHVIRRLGGLGDVIMTLPLCATFKRIIPHCTLTYVTDTEYAKGGLKEIAEHCPYIDRVISTKKYKSEEADYTVDVTSTGLIHEKSGTVPPNRIDMFAEEAGLSVEDNPVPCYIVEPTERELAKKEIMKYLGNKIRKNTNIIAIQVRSNDSRRTWPIEQTKGLIKRLQQDENNLILIFDWGKTIDMWKPLAASNIIPILDRSIADTGGLLEQCDIVVCPDSYILHHAGALNKKIVTIFGPIPPQSRINHYINATAVTYDKCPAQPCWYLPSCVRKVGTNGPEKFECLTKITVDMVYNTIQKKLKEEEKTFEQIIYGKDISVAGQNNIILVKRKTRGIGDILMALNGIEALKLKYPGKEIHLAVPKELHEILAYNPNIDRLLDSNQSINQKRYYLTADISTPCARYESGKVQRREPVQKSRVEIFAESLGTRNYIPDLLPRYYVSKEENKIAKQFFTTIKNKKKTIFFAPLSAEKYRDYPKEYWQELVDRLKLSYNILLATSKEGNDLKDINDISKKSFREKMAILNLCDGCITVDSAPLHVAAALNIPCVAIFGPIDPRARCKRYKNTTVLISDLDCVPCWRNGITKCKQKSKEHPQVISKCIELITPAKIAKVIKDKFI